MRVRKLRAIAICVMAAAGLMLASCGIAGVVNQAVAEVVQEVTGVAIDEMGGGPRVQLGVGDMDSLDLHISLVNNAISIQTHADNTVRVYFSPPLTGNYVIPTVEPVPLTNRMEITEPSGTTRTNYRPGVLFVYLPESAVASNLDLRTTNGAVRVAGNDGRLTDSVSVAVVNGVVELRDFNADNISATSTNGTISVNSLTADNLEMRTTNGFITARDSAVSGNLVARTVNGGVTLENVDADMGRADVNAVNGVVTVR